MGSLGDTEYNLKHAAPVWTDRNCHEWTGSSQQVGRRRDDWFQTGAQAPCSQP